MLTRSTVKFAQEVSEAKAMDSMLEKMEKLMGNDEKSGGSKSVCCNGFVVLIICN